MSAYLDAALEAAESAGRILRRKFTAPRQVRSKGWRDIVTDADFAADTAILNALRTRFPETVFLSEEGEQGADLSAPEPTWIIDPLDGTLNYSRQVPVFNVSIALAHRGQLRVGVVHDPMRQETFFAEHGEGAFARLGRRKPRALRVSALEDLGSGVIGVDWARDPLARRQTLEVANQLAPECRTLRALGSAALGLAYVAAGRLDGYFHLGTQAWDSAAGALLVAEAGGTATDAEGATWRPGIRQIVATNGKLHSPVLRAVQHASATG
jgi:myo-inositol-1(or 4)-monophosphatase